MMTPKNREALDAFYREGDSWAADREAGLSRSRTIAWSIAGVAVIVAVAEAIALAALAPLKTVVPYTLLVDRTTGFVQQLKPLEPQQINPDAALTQSFLVQYVIARESFDASALQSNYRKVGLWSADTARRSYIASMQASNPASPLVAIPRTSIVTTRVSSVSPLGNGAALVRFQTVRQDAGGRVQPPTPWVSVIRYRFAGEPMSVEDRYLNPLGFQVVRYQRNQEALSPAVTGQPLDSRAAQPSATTGQLSSEMMGPQR